MCSSCLQECTFSPELVAAFKTARGKALRAAMQGTGLEQEGSELILQESSMASVSPRRSTNEVGPLCRGPLAAALMQAQRPVGRQHGRSGDPYRCQAVHMHRCCTWLHDCLMSWRMGWAGCWSSGGQGGRPEGRSAAESCAVTHGWRCLH